MSKVVYAPPPRRPYATRRPERAAGMRRGVLITLCLGIALAAAGWKVAGIERKTEPSTPPTAYNARAQAEAREALRTEWRRDRVRRKHTGKASFYAANFFGRTMADGTPMKPHGDNAASRTLPLGTTAMVTNLETGKTAIVTIRDRGPYVGVGSSISRRPRQRRSESLAGKAWRGWR